MVSDTGYGLSQDDQNKMFTKFFRAESSAGKVLGTGLGLYITKLLIEKFGGMLGLSSELGKGSTFWFELPVTKRKQ
jgi:signal transduction histidine kinase